MKKILLVTILLILFSCLFAEETVALALKIKGQVILDRETVQSEISMGKALLNRDELFTGDKSFAAIRFIDGSSIVKLFSNSILTINAEKKNEKYEKNSYLKMGTLWTKVTKKTGSFDIETPTTVVSVRGTEFVIEVDEDGATRVYSISGKVNVEDKKSKKSILLEAGQVTSNDSSNPMEVESLDWDEMPAEVGEEVDETKVLKLELENSDGEKRSVKIEIE